MVWRTKKEHSARDSGLVFQACISTSRLHVVVLDMASATALVASE